MVYLHINIKKVSFLHIHPLVIFWNEIQKLFFFSDASNVKHSALRYPEREAFFRFNIHRTTSFSIKQPVKDSNDL